MESGISRKPIADFEEYENQLLDRMGRDEKLIRMMQNRARSNPKRVTLGNAEEYNVLKAAQILYEEGIAHPILLGEKIHQRTNGKFGIHLDVPIVDPMDDDQDENRKNTEKRFGDFTNRKGVNEYIAKRLVRNKEIILGHSCCNMVTRMHSL